MTHSVPSETLAAATDHLTAVTDGLDADGLTALGRDLGDTAATLGDYAHLRRVLTETTATAEAKSALIGRLWGDKVSPSCVALLQRLMALHWTNGAQLAAALRALSWTTMFIRAEGAGDLDDVEDELFRFGRIIEANPELSLILDDPTTPGEGRAALISTLLSGRTSPLTVELLANLARHPGRETFSHGVDEMVDYAAARGNRVVATVTSAITLSTLQVERLRRALGIIYSRDVTLHTVIDPSLIGGLSIRVGDEVIDGSVSGRLDHIRTALVR